MHSATLRKVGGSVMVAIPPVMLNELNMQAGEDVRLEIERSNIVIKPAPRKVWALAALLIASDYDTPMSEEEREWIAAPRAGAELL